MDIFFKKCIFLAYVWVVYRFLINIFKCNFRKHTPLLIIFHLRYYSIFIEQIYQVPKKSGQVLFMGYLVKNCKNVCNFVHLISKFSFHSCNVLFGFKKYQIITIIEKIRLLDFPVLLQYHLI